MRKKEDLTVKSSSKYLYQAFKKELEDLGYVYREDWNPFNDGVTDDTRGLYITSSWITDGKCSFTFSTPSVGKLYNLETEWCIALNKAKLIIEQSRKMRIPKIEGYELMIEEDVNGKRATFGCHTYKVKEVVRLYGLMSRNDIQFVQLNGGVKVSIKEIEEIMNYLEIKL